MLVETPQKALIIMNIYLIIGNRLRDEVCEKKRKICPTVQLFSGLAADEPVVIGFSKSINRSRLVYL